MTAPTTWTDLAARLDRRPETPVMAALRRLADVLSADAEQVADRIDEIADVAIASIEAIETHLRLETPPSWFQEDER